MAVSTIDQLRARMQNNVPAHPRPSPLSSSSNNSPSQFHGDPQPSSRRAPRLDRPSPPLEFSSRSSNSSSMDKLRSLSGYRHPCSGLPPPEPFLPPPSLSKSLPSSRPSLPPAEPSFSPPVLGGSRRPGSSSVENRSIMSERGPPSSFILLTNLSLQSLRRRRQD